MMLRVSTKGEYGVRIIVDLARHYDGRPRSLTDISQAEMLPLAYLEQLMKLLREAEPPLVISTRGAHGGYKLSRNPAQITMGEVVRALEGPLKAPRNTPFVEEAKVVLQEVRTSLATLVGSVGANPTTAVGPAARADAERGMPNSGASSPK